MKRLFRFFSRQNYFFLFLFLEIISFMLYANNESYPKSVFFSSSNVFVARFYSISNSVIEFVNLRVTNENLAKQNTMLQNKIIELENSLVAMELIESTPVTLGFSPENEYEFLTAKAINNSTGKSRNFITLNRGRLDGVRPDMGVVSPEGVVGIVKTVSDRFSVLVSVLNPMTHISSKIKSNNYVGSLAWDGEDYRYAFLNDIPRHVELNIGDSIVTSGLTRTFPEGVAVGTIDEFSINNDNSFYRVKVKLAVNFRLVSYVSVINYKNRQEQIQLEETED